MARASGPAFDASMREHLRGYDSADLESSVDIPPPAQLDPTPLEPGERRPRGGKDPYVGTTFDGRYKNEKPLGEGGMGVVYLARHKVIDKKVAIKVLRADLAKDREIVDRFVQEARSASSIGNPHIVDISDFGDLPDGSTYFVMEYLEGLPLTKHIEQKLDMRRLCEVALQISDGLAAAHEAGIVHRDLKPDNVYLVPRGAQKDFVKILDFGIAKVSNSGTTKLTRAGAVFGTPHYMSPEQAAGHPVDHRADIYSLGIIMYEMAAGQLPFNADNFMGILTQHMYKAPVPIRALVNNTDCPPGLEAIVQKCLSKKPEQRYATMSELGDDIRRLQKGESPLAVAELMNRSAGYSVPIDYFKNSGPQAILHATPAQKRTPWPTYVWVSGTAAAIAIVAGVFFIASREGEANVAPMPAPIASARAPDPAPAKAEKVVALAASPEAAVALRGADRIKLPASIRVTEGEKVALEISADGYTSQKIELDGTVESLMVRLEKIAAPEDSAKALPPAPPVRPPVGGPLPPRPPSTGGKKPPTTSGGGEIKDPWR
jgi:serine/threonine-protein kinase